MFKFRDRITKEVIKEVDITIEDLENNHQNDLVKIFAEYDVEKHIASYNSEVS